MIAAIELASADVPASHHSHNCPTDNDAPVTVAEEIVQVNVRTDTRG